MKRSRTLGELAVALKSSRHDAFIIIFDKTENSVQLLTDRFVSIEEVPLTTMIQQEERLDTFYRIYETPGMPPSTIQAAYLELETTLEDDDPDLLYCHDLAYPQETT